MKKKKSARWAYLDELDGRVVDDTPVRPPLRKPAPWEILLYAAAGVLWGAALYAILMESRVPPASSWWESTPSFCAPSSLRQDEDGVARPPSRAGWRASPAPAASARKPVTP